jgi:hypothetical protein
MLVAGPDWLTSVLAGMLGTNVWRVLALQMAPTALLIAGPATAAGAFQLRVAEGGSWLSLSSMLLFFAAVVQVRGTGGERAGSCLHGVFRWAQAYSCSRDATHACRCAGRRYHHVLLPN